MQTPCTVSWQQHTLSLGAMTKTVLLIPQVNTQQKRADAKKGRKGGAQKGRAQKGKAGGKQRR